MFWACVDTIYLKKFTKKRKLKKKKIVGENKIYLIFFILRLGSNCDPIK